MDKQKPNQRGTKIPVYQYDKTPMEGCLADFGADVRLHKVDETKHERLWDSIVRDYHYIGYDGMVGGRVKYLITLGSRVVGAISFCSGVYKLAPREAYVGWDAATCLKMLPHIVNNNRFLILPWIRVRNLASRILAMSLKSVRGDWKKKYGVDPYLAETFVDSETFRGTCYIAAGWVRLGSTKGYGLRSEGFVYHGRKKDIYVKIMNRRFAAEFRPSRLRLADERKELLAMINGTPIWFPSILKDIGVTQSGAAGISDALADHLSRYLPFLGRKELRPHMVAMAKGLLSDLRRKSTEPIAIAYEGVTEVRNLANFMTRSGWDDEGMLGEYRRELGETLSHPMGMITGDGCDFPKKGKASVGVARQYCGRLGKVDSCQAGVMVGYASPEGYGIVDYELYMPKTWFDEDHEALLRKCRVPSSVKFATKNRMLSDMIKRAIGSGHFKGKYIGVDSSFGNDHGFLDSLPGGFVYFADVHCDCPLFAGRPELSAPEYAGRGRRPSARFPSFPPSTAKKIAANDDLPWNDVVLGIGAKGPVITKDKCLKVVEVRDGMPGKDVWLYVRQLGDGSTKYALCNAPMNASIEEVRAPALMRWSIEQCFRECKNHLGMDHYESRSWPAWRRHILLTLISHLFVCKLRRRFSAQPRAPGSAPHIDTPVSLEDYMDAAMRMKLDQPIAHPAITSLPSDPQQVMTIGLIQKLILPFLVKTGELHDEINYLMKSSAEAFASHSRSMIDKALFEHGAMASPG
jgi:SRSO17 transposase